MQRRTQAWLLPALLTVCACMLGAQGDAPHVGGPPIKAALQERRVWVFADPAPTVTFDNQFSGARLNACTQVGPHDFKVLITPENEPINPSPWYAFRVKADAPVDITVHLVITTAKSRPRARVSTDGIIWKRVPDTDWQGAAGAPECVLKLHVGPQPTWVASNNMIGNEQLWSWTDMLATRPYAKTRVIGESTGGRPLKMVEFNDGAPPNYVVVIGRQHPPEVSGSVGLMRFVEAALGDSDLAKRFRTKFRVVMVPLVNPDGVHEGQWRSTLGAVDNNRDWHDFSQPESRAVRDVILEIQRRPDARMFLLLDFHATDRDIFYLPPDGSKTFPPDFAPRWVQAVQKRFPDYTVESTGAHNVDQWTFKRWAFETTGAPGITYELGSATPHDRIARIVSGAAEDAMTLLLESADAPRSEGPFPLSTDRIVEVKPKAGDPVTTGARP